MGNLIYRKAAQRLAICPLRTVYGTLGKRYAGMGARLGLRPLEKEFLKHLHRGMFWSILGHASLPSTPHPFAQAPPGQSGLVASRWYSTGPGGSSRSRPHPI